MTPGFSGTANLFSGCLHGIAWERACSICGRGSSTSVAQPSPQWVPEPFALGRIADALERIAAALEAYDPAPSSMTGEK